MTTLDHDYRRHLRLAISKRRLELVRDPDEGLCAGCGTPWSLPNPGCKTCGDRRRRASKRTDSEHRTFGLCAGCGTVWAKYTVGCRTCWDRRKRRRGVGQA